MRFGKGRVTAAEVARRAGVSQPTVSLILTRNPKARVAPETRERVLRIAEEIGYRPNRLAQALVARRSFAIGVIVPSFDNPFYAHVLSGAEKVAAESGYAVLLAEVGAADAVQHLQALRDRQVDGVIIAGVAASTLPPTELDDLNVVLVNQPSTRFASVAGDSEKAGQLAAAHLLGLGHRRVAFIGPATSIPAFRLRERGFVQALRAVGITLSSDLVVRAEASISGGLAAMRRVLALRDRPTAVFCANDLVALGAHKACGAAGVMLPTDLSLLGCDDIEMGTLVTPELSTILMPQRELGARAVRLLLRQLEATAASSSGAASAAGAVAATAPPAQVLPARLVVRGTTGVAPSGAGSAS
ncbi:MAG: LacI family DNA-binding transcriptional regulator [Gemmatimonadota bacterium]|nr:LacI family DNA-binding transcriptional regulator [Gemmatimonadota bacterium]